MTVSRMKAKQAKTPTTKPLVIKSGSAFVKLYTSSRAANGTRYPIFQLAYHDGVKRHRVAFSDRAEAEARAREIADKLNRGEKTAPAAHQRRPLRLGSLHRAPAAPQPPARRRRR